MPAQPVCCRCAGGLALAAGFGRRHRAAAVWSANAGLTARLAASADTWRSPACGAVLSQLAGRAAGAHAGRQPRPGAAVATWPGQRPTELATGWPGAPQPPGRPGRRGHQPGAGFLPASRITRPTASPPSGKPGRTTVWFTIQPRRAVQRQQTPLESGWPDWLSAQLSRQPGDYRWPPGTSRPQLGQCSPRSRRLTLAISLAAAVLGGGWFAWGEALNRQAAQLAEHTRALRQQPATGSQPGPGRSHAGTPRRPEQPADIAHALATPGRRSGCPGRTVGPPASAVSYGLALARRPCPAQSGQWRPCATGIARRRNLSARQALAELEQLLAACRQAGWNATLSHAPSIPARKPPCTAKARRSCGLSCS